MMTMVVCLFVDVSLSETANVDAAECALARSIRRFGCSSIASDVLIFYANARPVDCAVPKQSGIAREVGHIRMHASLIPSS